MSHCNVFVSRNLSSAGPDIRRAMRQCENLIDSLVYYIRGAVANFRSDDKVRWKYKKNTFNHLSVSMNEYMIILVFTSSSGLQSTENCVCILHNLSYQIESEVPQNYTQDVRASRQHLVPRPTILGCFAYRSAKIPEVIPLNNNPPWPYPSSPQLPNVTLCHI